MSKIREKNELDEKNMSELNEGRDDVPSVLGKWDIKRMFRKAKINMYKYVPPCPKCGSFCTGRYVKEPYSEKGKDYLERESLRFGEIVRFIQSIPYKNMFCVDCDYKWHGIVETKLISKDELDDMIEKRETYEAYIEAKEEQAFKNDTKKGGFFNL